MNPHEFLPAVGQGALAVECLSSASDVASAVGLLSHAPTTIACSAERAVMRKLEGGCSAPVAAHAAVDADGVMTLDAGVWSLDGSTSLRKSVSARVSQHSVGITLEAKELAACVAEAERVGTKLAEELLAEGAGDILKAAHAENRKE